MDWFSRCIDHVDRMTEAIERAKQLGTYNAFDRSKQYEQIHNADLVKAVNDAWTKIRQLEAANRTKDKTIGELHKAVSRYKWMNIALTSVLTGAAWEGMKALVMYLAYHR